MVGLNRGWSATRRRGGGVKQGGGREADTGMLDTWREVHRGTW